MQVEKITSTKVVMDMVTEENMLIVVANETDAHARACSYKDCMMGKDIQLSPRLTEKSPTVSPQLEEVDNSGLVPNSSNLDVQSAKTTDANCRKLGARDNTKTGKDSSMFGPWMLVKKIRRRPTHNKDATDLGKKRRIALDCAFKFWIMRRLTSQMMSKHKKWMEGSNNLMPISRKDERDNLLQKLARLVKSKLMSKDLIVVEAIRQRNGSKLAVANLPNPGAPGVGVAALSTSIPTPVEDDSLRMVEGLEPRTFPIRCENCIVDAMLTSIAFLKRMSLVQKHIILRDGLGFQTNILKKELVFLEVSGYCGTLIAGRLMLLSLIDILYT
ncbi:hypothetical protein HN51_007703 [Arachis hypogaea]